MLHAKDSLGGSRSSCFMRETGKDSPLSSSSKWWTRTSAGITRSASRFPWAHAVLFNTGKASALKCKPVQEIRRTPSGSDFGRCQHNAVYRANFLENRCGGPGPTQKWVGFAKSRLHRTGVTLAYGSSWSELLGVS